LAGAVRGRVGRPRAMGARLRPEALGLALIAAVSTPTIAYAGLVVPFAISGIGMGLFWAPVANVVLGSVPAEAQGQASGANSAIRELGGVLGVAVLAAGFAHVGGGPAGRGVPPAGEPPPPGRARAAPPRP